MKGLKQKYINDFIYIMKNMVYTRYLDAYTAGEDARVYTLRPEGVQADSYIIAPEAIAGSPLAN